MRITLTGSDRATGRSGDVVVHVRAGTTVGELVQEVALALGLPPSAVAGATVDGRAVDPARPVADGEVLDGARVELGDGPTRGPLPADLSTLQVIGGPGAGTVHVLAPGTAFVGSSP